MDCTNAIAILSATHVATLGIFAGYRIMINKQLVKLEKEEKKKEKDIKHLEEKLNKLEKIMIES